MTKISRQTKLTDYEGFVDKFVPKKTTDDCYTPQAVYDEVLRFVGELTDLTGREIVRPFWPGGDYERYDYPDNCIVVDNPPFSIYAKIVRFYLANRIDFFLFAPSITQTVNGANCCYIILGVNVTYENGAVVPTSFTTTLCKERVWCCPDLYKRLDSLNSVQSKTVTKIKLPANVVTPATLMRLSKCGVDYKIGAEQSAYVSKLDNYNQALFGRSFFISDEATKAKEQAEKDATEKAAAERALAGQLSLAGEVVIELSAREKAIIEILNKQSKLPSQSAPNPDSVSDHQPDSVSDHQPDSVSASRPNSDIC